MERGRKLVTFFCYLLSGTAEAGWGQPSGCPHPDVEKKLLTKTKMTRVRCRCRHWTTRRGSRGGLWET